MKIAYMILAAVVVIGLGGFLIHGYGAAKFEAGYAKRAEEQSRVSNEAAKEAISIRDKVENDNRKKKDDGITAELRSSGWLRAKNDR